MPTTSNFGWTTPADTDLVKDGAAAIRTLGNGIDTSLVDLKGGTTGQILSKNSNTDLDYTWVTPNVGDITEVQAGTGISVASGTGPIPVVTNSMATEITAKGDLIVGTGSGTFDNLPVGTNGHTLVADSATATGLKWAAASNPSYTPQTWSPTYQGFTLGNGTVIARYIQIDKLVYAYFSLTLGSTSSMTGNFAFSLPVAYNNSYVFQMACIDDSGVGLIAARAFFTANDCYVWAENASGTYVTRSTFSSTVPMTWATNDQILVNLIYEAD